MILILLPKSALHPWDSGHIKGRKTAGSIGWILGKTDAAQIFSCFYDTTEILIYREEIAMLDRSIPFYNTILRCDSYKHREVILPNKFSIVPYEKGYEKAWADLEYPVGDFDFWEEAENF